MTAAARWVAVLVGIAGIVLAMAAAVREIVLANDPSVTWPPATWWERLTHDPSWATTGVAAAVAAIATVLLLVLAFRQLGSSRRRHPGVIGFSGDGWGARVDVAALEATLRRHLEAALPGLATSALELTKPVTGWQVRLETDLVARDVSGVRRRATGFVAADLEQLGEIQLVALDLVVRRLLQPADAGEPGEPQA